MLESLTPERAKQLGAYYTPDPAVNFMVQWAVKEKKHIVIDPSYGDGIFLRKAVEQKSVSDPSKQLFGIEFDADTFHRHEEILKDEYRIVNLWNGDFFSSDPFFISHFEKEIPVESFDAVVGNPPFIRYQSFKGVQRAKALETAQKLGVEISEHASSWAPFLVQAISLIKPGGRLAMVIPAELSYAGYAQNVFKFLLSQFRSISILTFQKRLFPNLGEDTFIVLGEERKKTTQCLQLFNVQDENHLKNFEERKDIQDIGKFDVLAQTDINKLRLGKVRLIQYLLDSPIRDTYRKAGSHDDVKIFGSVATVSIGYVTGENNFFHVSSDEIKTFQLSKKYLQPCIRKSGDLPGIRLTEQDWENSSDEKRWLLNIPANKTFNNLPKGLQNYLLKGKERAIQRFKVRSREPWYSVPHVKTGDAFFTYMSHGGARLVHNALELPAPNSLHVVSLKKIMYKQPDIKLFIVAWYTSLTFLSAEIEGHSLGGGMLKLEPSELKNVLIALPDKLSKADINRAYKQIDQKLRARDIEGALDIGDALILERGLGFPHFECNLLRRGYCYLRDRRMNR
jgi:adenine-specific DNA-methyltransferase